MGRRPDLGGWRRGRAIRVNGWLTRAWLMPHLGPVLLHSEPPFAVSGQQTGRRRGRSTRMWGRGGAETVLQAFKRRPSFDTHQASWEQFFEKERVSFLKPGRQLHLLDWQAGSCGSIYKPGKWQGVSQLLASNRKTKLSSNYCNLKVTSQRPLKRP